MRKVGRIAIGLGLLVLTLEGCVHHCRVQPISTVQTRTDTEQKVAADLTKVVSAPVDVSLENKLKRSVDESYQKLPDHNIACQMILQSVICLSERKDEGADRAAQSLITYLSSKNICGEQVQAFRTLFAASM